MSKELLLLLSTLALSSIQAQAACADTNSDQTTPPIKVEAPDNKPLTRAAQTKAAAIAAAKAPAAAAKAAANAPAVVAKAAEVEVHKLFGGMASFYASKFHGRRTASGATYDQTKFTCAHRTLPFGTKLLVKNPANGKACIVTVNDRGPFHCKRVMDLSGAAAKTLGIKGVGNVVCYTGKSLNDPNVAQQLLTIGSAAP